MREQSHNAGYLRVCVVCHVEQDSEQCVIGCPVPTRLTTRELLRRMTAESNEAGLYEPEAQVQSGSNGVEE